MIPRDATAPLADGDGDGLQATLQELVALRARAAELAAPRLRSAERSSGPTVSAFRGRGMEYAESRPYTPGDDVRHIDWRVTARTGRAHSKVFQSERDRVTMLLVDRAPSMYFGTRVRLKSVQAARLAAVLAWAAQAEGDRLAAAAGTELVPPARGRRGVLRTLDALARWSSAPAIDPDPGRDASAGAADALARALGAANRVLHPGSHVLVLADLRSVDVALEQPLRQLAAHGEVVVGLVCDALELAPPPSGRYVACNARQRVSLGLADEEDAQAWAAHCAARRDAALALVRGCGARAAVVSAAEDCVAAVRGLLERRIARGRAA